MLKTHTGSCHCGEVRFAMDVDLRQETLRCNCSYCRKIRCWAVNVKPVAFRLLGGEAALKLYRFGQQREEHRFCTHCGVQVFSHIDSPMRGELYSVSVSCLDDVSAAEYAAAPVRYVDGLHDRWTTPPAITSYL